MLMIKNFPIKAATTEEIFVVAALISLLVDSRRRYLLFPFLWCFLAEAASCGAAEQVASARRTFGCDQQQLVTTSFVSSFTATKDTRH